MRTKEREIFMRITAFFLVVVSFFMSGIQSFSEDKNAGDSNSGTTTGTVIKTVRKVLTLKTDDEKELNFSLRPQEKGSKKTDLVEMILNKSTLKKGMTVTVKWTLGEKGIKYIDKLIAKGTMTGKVCDGNLVERILEPGDIITASMGGNITDSYLDGGILSIDDVEGIDGPVRFICRCVEGVYMKKGIKNKIWIPIPEEIKLLKDLCFKKEEKVYVPRVGARVTVDYELEDHLRINGLIQAKEELKMNDNSKEEKRKDTDLKK